MSGGIVARLRGTLDARADLGALLPPGWTDLGVDDLARRPVGLDGRTLPAGELFDLRGGAAGRIAFEGDLARADRIAAGLAEGEVVVDGDVGDEAGAGMSGGSVLVRGGAGARAGGALPEARRGMTGGELLVLGDAGAEAGSRMRRGLVAVGGRTGGHAGAGIIAGTVVLLGAAGPAAGLWSKRGSIVALGPIEIPPTYRFACTYQPTHLRLILSRLRERYGLPIEAQHVTGFYRRYSGDLAEIGKGEILQWTQ